MNNSPITIPFVELIRRSLSYVVYNFSVLFKMMLVPVLLMFVVQLLLKQNLISQFVILILMSYLGVGCCRKIVLNEAPVLSAEYFRNMLIYLLRYMGITLLMLIPGMIVLGVVYSSGEDATRAAVIEILAGRSNLETGINVLFWPLIAILIAGIYCARLRISLAGAAVNDQDIDMRQSFLLTEGNTWRIFGGLLITGLPAQIMYIVLMQISVILPPSNLAVLSVLFLSAIVSGLDICIKASFDAHMYQYFAYFYHKQIEDAEAAAATNLVEEKIKHRRD